ncbi:hypothetical protein DB30_03941 [Enhygromyxa salina]|uniref:Uncharacterized protein n=1 Tax=Enhygromyxa salina TaxID=215803 RepID=A0A0C2DAP5_9BACT|nr:hypothetical protein [Enhygromyxa salina]KIG16957.1 hypothetical protein DB30_03941 [Enhygromyxa salina]
MSDVAVLLLTEDNSKWAFETIEQLCRRIFDLLAPQVASGEWLTFAPVNDAARAEATAAWKSKKPRDHAKVLRLCRQIAEQVLRSDGFVFFHVDSDVTWGQDRSHNLDTFDEVIRGKVRAIVRGHFAKIDGDGAHGPRVECAMSKLITLTPYYSIEAWLFANVAQLRKLGVTGAVLDAWEADLSKLEQTIKPKQRLSISTRHYPTLARELKPANLYHLGSSFFETVNRAGACGSLIVRLRHRWPDWVRLQYCPEELEDAAR